MEAIDIRRLSDQEMEAALMTFHRFGNQSAASLWYQLAYLDARGRSETERKVWHLGVGTGLKVNNVLWECLHAANLAAQDQLVGPWRDCIHRSGCHSTSQNRLQRNTHASPPPSPLVAKTAIEGCLAHYDAAPPDTRCHRTHLTSRDRLAYHQTPPARLQHKAPSPRDAPPPCGDAVSVPAAQGALATRCTPATQRCRHHVDRARPPSRPSHEQAQRRSTKRAPDPVMVAPDLAIPAAPGQERRP
ncbi:hypothetical protein PR202_ga07205 [Eleusine coracana subsp. coracana]|uniref:Uncharacterized protein n=1 Tax=Eleusine coracana subsp. coracana TaxID=191504 RepID=A0AAV5BZG7_ELECO|nr:hypothetical protein PR202_ga07205 [Eleusine coracana subsp. coracana]